MQDLHPALWRAHQLGHQRQAAWPSGHAVLDAELPGAGWPARALTELLLAHPGVGEMRLLAPVLAAVQRQQRSVMLFDPPAALYGWAWCALGLDVQQLVVVNGRGRGRGSARGSAHDVLLAADTLWALEHALKSGLVGAVLAWLPQHVRADALRRLQLAAQAHDGPAFVLRHSLARSRPSAAPLRLLLAPGAPDELRVTLLKRRGPPLLRPLTLALAPVLAAPGRARALRAMPSVPAVGASEVDVDAAAARAAASAAV